MAPHYSLDEVKRIAELEIENPGTDKMVFSAPSKSINSVITSLKGRGRKLTAEKAAKYICLRLIDLKASDFIRTEAGQWGDPTCITDHYGLRYEGIPWFIKFRLDEDNVLDQISFHPTDRDMALANGTVIKKEWSAQ